MWQNIYNRQKISLIALILGLAGLLAGCGDSAVVVDQSFSVNTDTVYQETESNESSDIPDVQEETVGEETLSDEEATKEPVTETSEELFLDEKEKEFDIQLMMVGDNLLHMGIIRTGQQDDGSYNYDFLFDGIEDFLGEAEIKIINQETVFGGNVLGFSGYPKFNSPTEVGDAIAKAGFNVVLHASNHAADQKIEGLLHCVDFWEKYPEVVMAGIHEKGEDPVRILTVEGVDFAVLNYTYGPNLSTMPESVEGHLDMLCDYDEGTGAIDFTQLHPEVLTDIARAQEVADVVIVCPHWGNEYNTKPSVYQQKFALEMTEAGADLIIGTHPHVVQPVEWIEAENGNKALCCYSLGNYVSTQKKPISMLEAMAWISFHVTEDGVVIDEMSSGVLPLICHYTANPVRFEQVYLLEDYTEEKAASHGIKIYGEVDLGLGELRRISAEVFQDKVLSAEEILEGH